MPIRLRIDAGVAADVAAEVRRMVAGFRRLSRTDHRVSVRVVPAPCILSPAEVMCFGLFEGPPCKPHRWPATRAVRVCVSGVALDGFGLTRRQRVARIGRTVLHELVHYEQWRDGRPMTERGAELRAAHLRRKILATPKR